MSENNGDDLEFISPDDMFEVLRENDGAPAWHGIPPVNTPEGQTDLANARRFHASYGEIVQFCHPWGKWMIWDASRYKLDDTGAVMRLAKATADAVWSEARQFDDAAALRFAARTASAKGAQAMLSLAQSEVPILPADLDANPWLLNCPNGTVDLRTGELREHRREDNLTKLCPVEFDPRADCELWDRCLCDVFAGDDDMLGFWQRLMGYCATGDVREQILPIPWGAGANGKSTILEATTATLGPDYSGHAPKDLLMARKGESHPTELTELHGKRMIVAQETEQARTLNESLVKSLTGGDTITARRMREDFWRFNPTHKLILCTNHKPKVKGQDHAIWRRLRLVPFTVRFDGDRRDKTMPDKLKDERPGILAWLVRGAVDWLQHGLCEPEAVLVATAAYRSDSDIIGRFIADACIVSPDAKLRFGQFHEALEKACTEAGDNTPGKRACTEYLDDHGYKRRMNNGLWFNGLGLKTE